MGAVSLPAVLVAVLLLATLPGGVAAGDAASPVLRVVSFNLLHGGPSSGWRGDGVHLEERLALASSELQRLAPDVVGLQEASISRGRENRGATVSSGISVKG